MFLYYTTPANKIVYMTLINAMGKFLRAACGGQEMCNAAVTLAGVPVSQPHYTSRRTMQCVDQGGAITNSVPSYIVYRAVCQESYRLL